MVGLCFALVECMFSGEKASSSMPSMLFASSSVIDLSKLQYIPLLSSGVHVIPGLEGGYEAYLLAIQACTYETIRLPMADDGFVEPPDDDEAFGTVDGLTVELRPACSGEFVESSDNDESSDTVDGLTVELRLVCGDETPGTLDGLTVELRPACSGEFVESPDNDEVPDTVDGLTVELRLVCPWSECYVDTRPLSPLDLVVACTL